MAPSAKTTTAKMAQAPAGRSWAVTGPVALALLAASAAAYYLIHVEPAEAGDMAESRRILAAGAFDDGMPLLGDYTGIAGVDELLKLLNGAFLTGAAGWDRAAQLNQFHLLAQISTPVAAFAVESSRPRNRGKLITYTSVWAVLYQLMAGAVIMPIWLVLYLVGSGRSSYSPARNGRGSEVPAWCARWILPATLLGYVAPLLAMYVPWADVLNTSRAILVWQPAPIYINILLCLFPLLSPSPSPAGPTTTTAATAAGSTSHRQLKRAYAVLVALNAAAHLAVLYSVASAPAGSGVTWSTVFLPSRARRGEDFQGAWTWLFQVDLWGIYSTMLTWCAVEAYDLGGAAAALASAALTAAAGAALGPGAAMAAFWYWREDRIAALRATAAKVVGKKAA